MMTIDLNCDMGESFGVYKLGYDEEAMPYVTSINVACGFHASDPINMLKTVRLAKKYDVAVGAHPSFPDLVGFGRRVMAASIEEIKADVMYQIGALWAFCKAEGVKLQHVKPHGALYNVAEKDVTTAVAIAEAIKAVDPDLYMVCLGNSAMVEAAKKVGVKYVEEAFADRAYTSQGTLVPRKQAGAVIHDVNAVADRVLSMVKNKTVTAIDGTVVPISAQTICVHGDTPGAVEMIKAIRAKLEQENIILKAFGR
ncbi:LamB/YcsF family protein [Thermosinus carboxydivorans Nor1]|uniref:5-oxoprolinase subunit A n=1 Tax=Thermosinus carboxydivorans Nor1 TaxID=401526 RepID=A1HPE0_9FIRM|nr:5-oxoprolinase subunit PxpA [Thermosinus carboxydivorans]EAX48246.1 LamB/YcsF family protein [Thermosinus carboxydivorans Nor1]